MLDLGSYLFEHVLSVHDVLSAYVYRTDCLCTNAYVFAEVLVSEMY